MFFSVKYPVKLAGKTYIPCICYLLPRFLEMTVEKLVKEEIIATRSHYYVLDKPGNESKAADNQYGYGDK